MISVKKKNRTYLKDAAERAGIGGIIAWHAYDEESPTTSFKVLEVLEDYVLLDGVDGSEKNKRDYRLSYSGHGSGTKWSIQEHGAPARTMPGHEVRCGDCGNVVGYTAKKSKELLLCVSCFDGKVVT